MRRTLIALIAAPALVMSAPLMAAEIPAGLDRAVVAAPQQTPTAAEVQNLDAAERAELAQSDPARKGGDTLLAIAVIIAVVTMVWMYFQHEENMSR